MAAAQRQSPGVLPEAEGFDLLALMSLAAPLLVEQAMAALRQRGFTGVRLSHGRLFQHLQQGPQAVSELARNTGVTPQAVSKTVGPLAELGYVDLRTGSDARVRLVTLTDRGRALIVAARETRAAVVAQLAESHGEARVADARGLLVDVLSDLGVVDDVRTRRMTLRSD